MAALRMKGIPVPPGHTPLDKAGGMREGVVRLRRFIEGQEVEYEEPDWPVTERACTAEGAWFTQTMLLGTKEDMHDIVGAILKIQRARA